MAGSSITDCSAYNDSVFDTSPGVLHSRQPEQRLLSVKGLGDILWLPTESSLTLPFVE